jgi:hypothetical protein
VQVGAVSAGGGVFALVLTARRRGGTTRKGGTTDRGNASLHQERMEVRPEGAPLGTVTAIGGRASFLFTWSGAFRAAATSNEPMASTGARVQGHLLEVGPDLDLQQRTERDHEVNTHPWILSLTCRNKTRMDEIVREREFTTRCCVGRLAVAAFL